MTLEEAIAEFESQFDRVIVGEPSATMPTGDLYVTLTSGGVKLQGEPFPGYHNTKEAAVQGWRAFAVLFVTQYVGKTLYWRIKPILENKPRTKRWWVVYSRLGIGP